MNTQNSVSDADVEKGPIHTPNAKMTSSKSTVEILEAAALLTIWSVLVINEGSIRLIESNPSVDITAPGNPSRMLILLGGVAEVFFGLLGLGLGVAAFIPRWYSTALTKLSMVIQTIFGYYVFVIFVFLIPAFRAANLTTPVLEGLSISSSRFLIVMGIFTSFHFCLALQGGQFLFMARLVCAITGEDFLKQTSGNRMRALFWNGNFALSGLWTFISGLLVSVNVGSGRLAMPFVSPPNVGTVPGLTIATGLVMMVWGVLGMAFGASKKAPTFFFAGTGAVYLLAMLNFGIAQFSTFSGPGTAAAVALHNGLVFMVVFLGPFFVYTSYKETEAE